MEAALRPTRLEVMPSNEYAARVFAHWKVTLENYLRILPMDGRSSINDQKFRVLTNFLSPLHYQIVRDKTYDEAMECLGAMFRFQIPD